MTSAVINLLGFFLLMLALVLIALVLLAQRTRPALTRISSQQYLLVYASQSGQTADYAHQTARQFVASGIDVVVMDAADLTPTLLQQAHQVIWMLSTYGEGDAPDTTRSFAKWLAEQKLDLSRQSFAMLGFGDRRYDAFCAFAIRVNNRLIQLGAQPWFEMICVDAQSKRDLHDWNHQLSQMLKHDLSMTQKEKPWQVIQLKSRRLLNEGSQGSGLYHLSFTVPKELYWQSGDLLEIRCFNTEQQLQAYHQQYPQISLKQLTTLKYKNLRTAPEIQPEQVFEDWLNHLHELPIREYSIASIPAQGQLDLVVRQEITTFGPGLGSSLLTQGLGVGESLYIHVRSNPSFHLNPSNVPQIFIGNGSGIAGLLAHLHQRQQLKHSQNWLIYGERQQQFDQVFAALLQQWQQQGHLTYLDCVYSRDGGNCRYVQDQLRAEAERLHAWVQQGAVIYVCGSLQGMAQGVEQALLDILGAESLAQLKREQRYLRDVY